MKEFKKGDVVHMKKGVRSAFGKTWKDELMVEVAGVEDQPIWCIDCDNRSIVVMGYELVKKRKTLLKELVSNATH